MPKEPTVIIPFTDTAAQMQPVFDHWASKTNVSDAIERFRTIFSAATVLEFVKNYAKTYGW